ncbi:homeobox protein BEL1 homolog [Curcuma longa]|uniref:homeobox protein BEL1 homolog n=1 Tax=Curcuma longa TaxID=136217 RepID=UPI003D9EA981
MAYDQSAHHPTLGYTDFSSGAGAMQSFQSSQELYGLHQAAAGMDIVGRTFFPPVAAAASSSSTAAPPMSEHLMCPWPPAQQNRMLVDVDHSAARFLFPAAPPCEPPPMALATSSGLSLSLNHALTNSRDHHHHHQQQPHQLLKNSKFSIPARELLNEFCNLEIASAAAAAAAAAASGRSSKLKAGAKSKQQWEGGGPSSSSNPANHSTLYTLNVHELQARKAKLLAMLEEVDNRYRRYREQMRAVVASFEAVAGEGAATVYSALAAKVMSRHFRCLRDGIAEQVQAMRRAMGEKDEAVAPGTTRGETPRLKMIDQCLRQQRAFHHAGMMESHPWRPQRGLPERSVSILRAWLFEHFLHPYPSDVDKHILARQTGLSRSQVSNWFINARVRLWKPMVEEMYMEETKDNEMQTSQLDDATDDNNDNNDAAGRRLLYNHLQQEMDEEQKPGAGQLQLPDPDSLSWVISGRDGAGSSKGYQNPSESFGVIDIDFASYGGGAGPGMPHAGGVSLTLGLQQHDGGAGTGRAGVSLSFSPPATQLLAREVQIGERQAAGTSHQFSSMMEDEAQNATVYRNLMGAHQLLRDLAG